MPAPADDREIPLYVDLDGTLLRTDSLWESFASALRREPLGAIAALVVLASGRAAFKRRVARLGAPEAATMPRHEAFLAWLRGQRATGRRIVLATAADHALARSVAGSIAGSVAGSIAGSVAGSADLAAPAAPGGGLFDAVLASDGRHNLKGRHKLEAIRRDAGGASFDYCGNGPEDLPIFASARRAILVGAPARVLRKARRDAEVAAVFDPPLPAAQRLRAWLGAMRPHQWLKNLLVLVPLLTSFRLDEPQALWNAALACAAFSLAASSGYLLNDLLDLAADRRHPRKRERAFAAGRLPARSGFAVSALLLVAALALAAAVGVRFALWVLAYLAMTGLYSGFAKRVALLDVATLAGLYTVRVLAGGAAIDVVVSFWLLAFSVFLFFSLALVKRCGELVAQFERDEDTAAGRSYGVEDLPVLRSLGIATSCSALLVLALYVQEPAVAQRYGSPQVLWLMLVGLLIWLGRLWLATARGAMHDDPLVFALRDRGSRWLVGVLLLLFGAAALSPWPG